MISFNEILEAYTFLKTNNHTIPSEVIEFMKDSAMQKLTEIIYSTPPEEKVLKFSKLDNIGDLIELEEFMGGVECLSFTEDDGFGYLASATEQSNIEVNLYELFDNFKEKYPWCTHIQWYNK